MHANHPRYAETDMWHRLPCQPLLYFEDARAVPRGYRFPYDHIEQAGYLSPVTHFECDYGALCVTATRLPAHARSVLAPDEDRIRLRGVPGRPGSRHREALLHGTGTHCPLMLKRSSRSV
ncbi:MAG: hypothetical protein ACLT98_14825 [Eggerthellaceae bacterium]